MFQYNSDLHLGEVDAVTQTQLEFTWTSQTIGTKSNKLPKTLYWNTDITRFVTKQQKNINKLIKIVENIACNSAIRRIFGLYVNKAFARQTKQSLVISKNKRKCWSFLAIRYRHQLELCIWLCFLQMLSSKGFTYQRQSFFRNYTLVPKLIWWKMLSLKKNLSK